MSWVCERCEKTNSDDHASRCEHCRQPNALFEPDRGEWTCPKCGVDNGGGSKRCGKCNELKP